MATIGDLGDEVSATCNSWSAVVGHGIIGLIHDIKIPKWVRLLISNAPYQIRDRTEFNSSSSPLNQAICDRRGALLDERTPSPTPVARQLITT